MSPAGDACEVKDRARVIAVAGQRGDQGMRGRGKRTTISLNWMVLLQQVATKNPKGRGRLKICAHSVLKRIQGPGGAGKQVTYT